MMENIKISLITVCLNSEATIRETIESVLSQSYKNVEYIIIDGLSSDMTTDVVKSYGSRISKFISEKDSGIYAAINKGIKHATGEIVGIIHSDDYFPDNYVLEKIVSAFLEYNTASVFGDVFFINPKTHKMVRYYSSRRFSPDRFRLGYMPAHTSFFAKRSLFDKYGSYKENYKIAADFELLIRFLYNYKISYKYIPIPVSVMRTGGISNKNIISRIILNKEIVRACAENNIKTNIVVIYMKYFLKIFEYLTARKLSNLFRG